MTGDFVEFFELVRKAAKQCGIQAHVICGVASDGAGGQVKVASNGVHGFDVKKEAVFIERYVDAMGESLDATLARMAGDDEPPPELRN